LNPRQLLGRAAAAAYVQKESANFSLSAARAEDLNKKAASFRRFDDVCHFVYSAVYPRVSFVPHLDRSMTEHDQPNGRHFVTMNVWDVGLS